MPGPPPNPNAIRRNTRQGLTRLPAGGRRKPAPKWPLPDNPRLAARVDMAAEVIEELEEKDITEGKLSRTDRTKLTRARERLVIAEVERDAVLAAEKELWRALWKTPQAVEWDRFMWTRGVALYARHQAAAECGSLDDSKEARQRADALGLTPKGLRDRMWVIDHDEVGEKRQARDYAATGTEGKTGRRQLRAVDPTED